MARRDDRLIAAARRALALLREAADLHFSVRLWDGSIEPLGSAPEPGLALRIASPGVIASILRRPTLDRVIRHYARGGIDIEGGTLVDFGRPLALDSGVRRRLRRIPKLALARAAWPFLIAKADAPGESRLFRGDAEGANRVAGEDDKRYVQFHYDVGNEFYALFLDPSMQYSCAYFPTVETSLEEAQAAKLEMICRKLRLRPGDRLLDIGCGWGGLIAHAVTRHGVTAHGVTLSPAQLTLAQERMARLGIAEKVTLELRDYRDLARTHAGGFDKIASIGMYEHIGIANIPTYFATVRRLLADDGLFLNHAIARGAKKNRKRFAVRPEHKAIQRYIFPGGELDDVGHSIAEMERAGFEVADVEGWRMHYHRTTDLWCRRLTMRRAEAEALVGAETTRIWLAYLGGVSLGFLRGSLRLFQTLATRSAKGPSPLPPTRADLYR